MKQSLAYFLLVLTMLFWAINFYVVKIAMEFYSPMGVGALRFLFGVLALIAILYFQFEKRMFSFRFTLKEFWYLFLTSFFGIFLTIYFFNIGLKTTSAVNGSLIIATSPAITALLTYFFQQNRLKLIQKAAIFISFFGVAVILTKGKLDAILNLEFAIGDMYILGMALVFSISQLIVSKYLSHLDAVVMTSITSLIAFVLFALLSFPEFISTPWPTTVSFWVSILFMGIISTGIAYTAFYYCVVRLGPTISTLYMNLIPFFTVLLAFPFGEQLYIEQCIGGALIVFGLIVFGMNKKRVVAV